MTILEMLNRLAEIAPDSCKIIGPPEFKPHYQIGEYEFWQHPTYGFLANRYQVGGNSVDGRPALAWLADAIMAECEKRGWYFDIAYLPKIKKYHTDIKPGVKPELQSNKCNDNAESLLAAFLAVMEGER